MNKKIKILAREKIVGMIEKEINTKLIQSFTCPIPLYHNAYRYISKNIEEIKKENSGLSEVKIEFEEVAQCVIIHGKIAVIEKAKN